MSNDTKTLPGEFNTNASPFMTKLTKILTLLKPTIINLGTTFVIFLISIIGSKNLFVAISCCLVTYLLTALLIQPLLKDKFKVKLLDLSFFKSNEKSTLVKTNNRTIILAKKGRNLIAITLLKLEFFGEFLNLETIWDFLMEEGIIIQDCRAGCFFIIKKTAKLKNSDLKDQAKKLIKELEKTILLTKKKIDIVYKQVSLQIIKRKELIFEILQLGQTSEKFLVVENQLSDNDINVLNTEPAQQDEIVGEGTQQN